MREKLRFLGLDVHAETIAVAVAEPDGEVRSLGTIANREDSIRKFIRRLGSPENLRDGLPVAEWPVIQAERVVHVVKRVVPGHGWLTACKKRGLS
jgi:hypothetical protein